MQNTAAKRDKRRSNTPLSLFIRVAGAAHKLVLEICI